LHVYPEDIVTQCLTLALIVTVLTFIHSFIMHSVNPYKVNQPIGYRPCHNTSVL